MATSLTHDQQANATPHLLRCLFAAAAAGAASPVAAVALVLKLSLTMEVLQYIHIRVRTLQRQFGTSTLHRQLLHL
jgi:hypothetical protein